MKPASFQPGMIIVRFGPIGGPGPNLLTPASCSPWHSVQVRMETRYLPYAAEVPSGGAITGCVTGGCALVGDMPTPRIKAARTFNFAGGVLDPAAGCERRYATMASASESLKLRKTCEGMIMR